MTNTERNVKMAEISRKEARNTVYELLFETEFRRDEAPEHILDTAIEVRELPVDEYVRTVYFGVLENKEKIDELIGKYSKGWKVDRISKVAVCAMRICIYEMLFVENIPVNVSINEAIELTKKYDEEKTRGFVNGVLNGVKDFILASKSSGSDQI